MGGKSIRVYTRYLDLLTETDVYQSLQFERSYHFVGEFELHINRYMQGAEHFVKGNIIAIDRQPNKAGIIHTQEIELDENGRETETFIVKGESVDSLMARRVSVPPSHTSHDRKSGSAESVMKHYVRNNFINPTDKSRELERLEIADDYGRGTQVSWESRFKNVASELNDISITTNLGWGVFVDFASKKFIFDVYQAHDLTKGNTEGNSPVFFSPEFDSIKSQRFIDSDANYRNVAYVGGQGEGVERKIIQLNEKEGWERLEEFVDARDIGDKDEETDRELTEEEVEQLLAKRGTAKLADLEQLFSLEAEIITPIANHSTFQYEVDYNLGDTVEVFNKSWGIEMKAPIVSVTEIYEEGGFTLQATFGEDRPTFISKIKRKFDQLEGVDMQEQPGKVAVKRMGEAKEHTDQEIHKTVEYVDEQDAAYNEAAERYAEEQARLSVEEAVTEAVRQDELLREDAMKAADDAREAAISASVGKEMYNKQYEELLDKIANIGGMDDAQLIELMDRITSIEAEQTAVKADIATKVDGAWVDGKLKTKADSATTYTKSDVDGKFDNTVSKTEWTTDKDGIVKDLTDYGTRLKQTETELLSTAKQVELDGVKNELTTAKTSISQNAKSIGLKADQTVVDTISGKTEANAAELKVQAGKISAKLDSTTYTTDKAGIVKDIAANKAEITATSKEIATKVSRDEFEALEIGGRNLIRDSERIHKPENVSYINISRNGISKGIYTISFSYETVKEIIVFDRFLVYIGRSLAYVRRNDTEDRVFITFEVDVRAENTPIFLYLGANASESKVNDGYFVELKLEKGNKATDWTPAPEDVDTAISSANTLIKQNADAITLRATKDEVSADRTKLNTAVSDITTNANAIKLRATSTQLNASNKRITDAESAIKVNSDAIALRATKSSVDGLTGRVSKAESTLSVLPGQIEAKVEKDGVISSINAQPGNLQINFAKVKMAGAIEAGHIKSLNGLNVGNQFLVDNTGNVTFKGKLTGATGTFSGDISAKQLKLRAPTVKDFGNGFGLQLESAISQASTTAPFKRTGYINFLSNNDILEINRENNAGARHPLAGFQVDAEYNRFLGKMDISPTRATGAGGDVLSLTGGEANHVYMEFYRTWTGRDAYFGIPSPNYKYITLNADNKALPDGIYLNAVKTEFKGRVQNQDTYNVTTTAGANMYVASNGYYARSSSARRYKLLEQPIKTDPYKILDVQPKDWYDKGQAEGLAEEMSLEFKGEEADFEKLDTTKIKRIPGLVAEDVEDAGLNEYVIYGEGGETEGVQYDRIWTLLIPIVKEHEETIAELRDEIKLLKGDDK